MLQKEMQIKLYGDNYFIIVTIFNSSPIYVEFR